MFFSDLGVEITPESEVRRCLNHGKYICFCKIPLPRLIGDLRVLREALGPHFGSIWGTLGSILVVWEGPGTGWNFDGLWDPPWDHPKLRAHGQGRLRVCLGGQVSSYKCQIADLQTAKRHIARLEI